MTSHEDPSKINRDELLREVEGHANPPKSPEAEHTDPGAKVRNELHGIFGPDLGDQIAQAMSDVNSIQEKNRKSADEVMNKMAEVLGSMPPEKSKKIFEEVINGMITNNPYGPVPEGYRIKFQSLLDQVRLMPDSITGKDDSKKTGRYKIIDVVPSEAESQPVVEVVPESEIIPTEADLKENYEATLSLFGEQPFIFEDFVWHAQGLDWENATENEKSLAAKIFATLLAEGKFKKVGDGSNKYKVVPEKATSAEPASEPISVPAPAEVPQPEPVAEVVPLLPESEPNVPSIQTELVEQVIPMIEEKEGLELEIENAKSFDELYEVLNKADGIQSSDTYYSALTLIKSIADFRRHPNAIILSFITKTNGLRDKVKRLSEAEELETEATKVIPLPAEEILAPADVPPQPEVLPVIQVGEILPPATPEIPVTPTIPSTPKSLETVEVTLPPDLTPPPLRMPPPITPKTPENIPVIDQELEDMKNRAKPYAAAQIALKNKNRENKNKLFKIASDLAGSVGLGETTEDIIQNRGFLHRTAKALTPTLDLERKTDNIFRRLNGVTPQNMAPLREELIVAESAYIAAKKEKMAEVRKAPVTDAEIKNVFPDFDPVKTLTPAERNEKEHAVLQFRTMAQAEKEWDTLQKMIAENIPPQEKGRIGRGFENWAKLPMWQRVAISSVTMTGVGLLLGTVGVDAEHTLAAVAGYRVARSVGGAFAGQLAGKMTDVITKRSLEKAKQKRLGKYAEGLTGDNYESRERRLMELKEEEENRKKRGILKKAGAMMVVGAGVNIGTDLTLAHHFDLATGAMPKGEHGFLYKMFHHDNAPKTGDAKGIVGGVIDQKPGAGNIPRGTKLNTNVPPSADHLPGPKSGTALASAEKPPVSAIPRTEAPVPVKSPVPTELTQKIPETVNVAEVELNKLGFIKTFHEMKEQLKLKYPNPEATDVPTGVKHFLTTPSTKLAQEYGFWDIKHGTSGMGLKGEHLAVDDAGHLKLEHLAGKPTEVIDTGANKFDTLHSDKMFVPKVLVSHEVVAPKVTEPITSAEVAPESGNYLDSSYKPFDSSNIPKPVGQFDPSDFSHAKFNTHSVIEQNPTKHLSEPVISTPRADEFGQPVVPGAKVAETFHSTLDFTHHSASGMDLRIKVAEVTGGQKNILVGDTAIANQVSLPDGSTRMQLFDNLQHGKQSAILREAFVAAQEKMEVALPKGASSGYHLPFDHGTVDLVHGTPGDPNEIHAYLNGKEIAKGLSTAKGPNLALDPTLHRQFWWQGDTVYDTAFKFLKKNIKLRDNSNILKDLTLPRVVNK